MKVITQKGYDKITELDSIRAIRVLMTLLKLTDDENKITITQVDLAKKLNLKNKSNVNVALSELLDKDFVRKKEDKKKITYFLNPNFFLSDLGFTELEEKYSKLLDEKSFFDDTDFNALYNEFELKGDEENA